MSDKEKKPWIPSKEYYESLWRVTDEALEKCKSEPDKDKLVKIDVDSLYRMTTACRVLMFMWNDIVREVKLPDLMQEYAEKALGFKADPTKKFGEVDDDDDDDVEGDEWKNA